MRKWFVRGYQTFVRKHGYRRFFPHNVTSTDVGLNDVRLEYRQLCTKPLWFQSDVGESYGLRRLTLQDLPAVFNIFDEDNWIFEKACLKCAFDTDGRGLYVIVDKNSEVIGSVCYYLHDNDQASFGLLMLRKKYRKSDIGIMAGKHILYSIKNKFMFGYTWTNMQTIFKNEFPFLAEPTWYNYGIRKSSSQTIDRRLLSDVHLLNLRHVSMSDLLEYDTDIHTFPRIRYMTHWLQHNDSITLVAKCSGEIVGFGVLRKQDELHQIAPLYANNDDVAQLLFFELLSKVPSGARFGYISFLRNSFATEISFLQKLLKPGLPMIGAFSKQPIQFEVKKVYALSSVSFGLC